MNEVSKIHLGRQAFTIALDAQKELRKYIDEITDLVSDKDVVDEVELRMAELLTERGINGDKVILPKDIHYLKSQLGNPSDFKDSDDEHVKTVKIESRRLFRDTDEAILAGVASGLSKYFGVDVLLIRLLFIIGVFTGGWGIILYIALWLLVPEATTSSEKLQMIGKPVTVSSLKDTVARADVSGAAHRANTKLAGPINTIFTVCLKIFGLVLIIGALTFLFALIALESYVLVHTGNLFEQSIFPIGIKERILLELVIAVIALVAILIVFIGISIFKQRRAVKSWVMGSLVGLIIISFASCIALGVDAAPQIRDRYNANFHESSRTLQPFSDVRINGDLKIRYEVSSTYGVSFHYFGNPNLKTILTSVNKNTLSINSSNFPTKRPCSSLCIPKDYSLEVTVQAPITPTIEDNTGVPFDVPEIPSVPKLAN